MSPSQTALSNFPKPRRVPVAMQRATSCVPGHAWIARLASHLATFILACSVPSSVFSQIYFSEIHYHPVEEASFNGDGTPVLDLAHDVHEFVEFHNAGSALVSLESWKISGGVDFTFPRGASIQPGGYLVVAKDKARLAKVQAYQLVESSLHGPFEGQLSNEGETIRLLNASGHPIDAVNYSAHFPWAIGANALGADEEWTGLRNLDYQYRGRSLERVSFSHPSNDPANWLGSPIPGNPSPGKPNAIRREHPLPIVTSISVLQALDRQALIRMNQPVRVEVVLSSLQELGPLELEYFADNINLSDEPVTKIAMTAIQSGGTSFTATIPGMADRSIVRYRIAAVRAGRREILSPRADDPFAWHAYFVSPLRNSTKPIYDCFISTASLSRLAANIAGNPRRVTSPDPPGNPRASWNATEPAVFVHEGVVRDIRMRHHGSRYNRRADRNSFKWHFPRYNPYLGTDSIFETDKGNDFVVGHQLFINAGFPVSKVRYVDVYLNGNPAMQRLEQGEFNGDMLDEFHANQQAQNPGASREASGEIYKSVGTIQANGEGPYGVGDGRRLSKAPTWPDWKMYEWTYSLQNHGWKGATEMKAMLDGLWAARGDTHTSPRPNIDRLRAFMSQHFDIDSMLNYIAIENWCCPWDDTTQNHFLWRKSNGKWSMLPWDCDAWFGRGDNTPATSSIYIGEVGDPNNNFRGPNFIKDSFIKAFRQEYKQRLYLLNNTFLHPENITAMGFQSIRTFANTRFTSVNQQCGFGPFQRPAKPTLLAPTAGQSVVPGVSFKSSPYAHSATPATTHAQTLWEIRSANGNYLAPVFKLTSSTQLIELPIPFRELEFGATYYWRCTHLDALGHPSIPSDESSFSFGGITSSHTNAVRLVSIDASSVWRYNQSGANLGTAWKEPGFNDSAWPSGASLLAMESAELPEPVRTVLTLGPTTFYFRRQFNYSGPASATLRLLTVIDDGAVLYLNGNEIWRNRVSGNPPTSATLADSNVSDAVQEGPFDLFVTNLIQGANTLAAEVHQSAVASSDVVFGLVLDHLKVSTAAQGDLILNEILADNRSAAAAGDTYPDYVEIANNSDRTVSLEGYALTDDVLNPTRFRFPPGISIPAKGFLVVWCGETNGAPGLHTGFGLNNAGQTVLLLAPVSGGFSPVDSIRFGAQVPDKSIGRTRPDSDSWVLNEPTPGSANRTSTLGALSQISINEWMASPASGDDWFELYNRGNLPVALGGHFLTGDLGNPTQSPIAPLTFINGQGHLVFFADGNPGSGPDHTNFKLSAGGDAIGLFSSDRVPAHSVTFGPQRPGVSQGSLPDGATSVVSFVDSSTQGDRNRLPIPDIHINEVLTHSDPPAEDAIEIHNSSNNTLNITGWHLSDDKNTPRKFKFPAGSTIAPGGFLVVYESQFNTDTNSPTSFALSSARGDEVVLSATDATGNLTGYQVIASFGPAFRGVSFGRFKTSIGFDFVAMHSTTFGSEPAQTLQEFRSGKGAPNVVPLLSAVQISEIMYHPPDIVAGTNRMDNTGHEFVELRNTSSVPQALFDPLYPTNVWRVRGGIEMELPKGIALAPGGHLLLVNFDPQTNSSALNSFRAQYPNSSGALLAGPYRGKLSNDSDRIDLLQPDSPQTQGPDRGLVPYVLVDRVRYSDAPPWPAEADGTGTSLHRRADQLYGNDPANWGAGSPTPGSGGIPPTALILLISRSSLEGNEVQIQYVTLPGKTHQLEYRDSLVSGSWIKLGPPQIGSGATGVMLKDTPPPATRERYYRITAF